jgi:Flp pilus assembly protein TadG
MLARYQAKLRLFSHDTRGVAAIEMALCGLLLVLGILNGRCRRLCLQENASRQCGPSRCAGRPEHLQVQLLAARDAELSWLEWYDYYCDPKHITGHRSKAGVGLPARRLLLRQFDFRRTTSRWQPGQPAGELLGGGERGCVSWRLYPSRCDLPIRFAIPQSHGHRSVEPFVDCDNKLDAIGLIDALPITKSFYDCLSGVAAVEFALVAPLFFALTIGGVYTGLVVFAAAGLHDASEQAARCYAVNAGQCGTAAQAQTYAKNAYYGLNTPTFTASLQACGYQVAATVTVELTAIITELNVPLSANACFPKIS